MNVLDMPEEGDENAGLSSVEFEEGGYLARRVDEFEEISQILNLRQPTLLPLNNTTLQRSSILPEIQPQFDGQTVAKSIQSILKA